MQFPSLACHFVGVPLLLQPNKSKFVAAALAEQTALTELGRPRRRGFQPGQPALWDGDDDALSVPSSSSSAYNRGYDICDGIAQIPISGLLIPKLGWPRPLWGMTGYDTIRNAFLGALVDPLVRAITFQIDTPGGACAGCFDLVDTIYAARKIKPIWAVVDANACSAGYALASAAQCIVMPQVGFVGSIGVIVMHIDFSGALKQEGLDVTLITYGDKKADASPTHPLSRSARDDMQEDVDAIGELFVARVARNRGLSAEVIKGTEAGVYMGDKAVNIGLADAIMAPDEAHRALKKKIK